MFSFSTTEWFLAYGVLALLYIAYWHFKTYAPVPLMGVTRAIPHTLTAFTIGMTITGLMYFAVWKLSWNHPLLLLVFTMFGCAITIPISVVSWELRNQRTRKSS